MPPCYCKGPAWPGRRSLRCPTRCRGVARGGMEGAAELYLARLSMALVLLAGLLVRADHYPHKSDARMIHFRRRERSFGDAG